MIRGVPYDHQLEYIESTGTQYIRTGVLFNSSSLVFDIEMSIDNNLTGWSDEFMGAFVSDGNDGTGVRARVYGDSVNLDASYMNIPRACPGIDSWTKPVKGEGFVTIHLELGNITISRNGVVYGQKTASGTKTPCGKEIFLFAGGQNGSAFRRSTGMKVKSYKVTSGNTVVQDLIPVRVGTTALMYDRVKGTFPKHYGTFVAGPVASTPLMGVYMYPQVYTATDCVHNGLVGLYDAIENAGVGTHGIHIWKNLEGGLPDLAFNGCTVNPNSVTVETNGYISTPLINSDPYVSIDDVKAIRYTDPGFTNEGTIEFVYKSGISTTTLVSGFNETSIGSDSSRNYWKCYNGSAWAYFTTPTSYPPPMDGKIHKVTVVYGPYDFRQYVDGTLTYSNVAYAKYGFFNDMIIIGKARYGSANSGPWEAYTLRVYSRKLANDERAHNDYIDYRRFNVARSI